MTDEASLTAPQLCSGDTLRGILRDLSGQNAVLVGLGLFGGGEGAARYLATHGANVLVTDQKPAERLTPALDRLADLPLCYRLGENDIEDILKADLVILNPAVPRDGELVRACAEANIPITSPMNLFLTLCPAPIAAVTGSVGKSTTTSMLASMLEMDQRSTHLGGNMGISLLPQIDSIGKTDLVVLELSSVQLEDAAHLPWSPHVGVITNIIPNHLDRYGSFSAYAAAKKHILLNQNPSDAAVLNIQDSTLREWVREEPTAHTLCFDAGGHTDDFKNGTTLRGGRLVWSHNGSQQVICPAEQVPLPGKHNVANALAASAAARWMGVSTDNIRDALNSFTPLEHRLEQCGHIRGITFYNDSDSTTPHSTIAGVESFESPLTLIAGGYNKDLDLRFLADTVVERVEVLITLGTSGPEIAQSTREAALREGHQPVIQETENLEEAVNRAYELSMPGSTILFSPACASFDMFENFADRGRRFKNIVRDLCEKHAPRSADCA
ncbi:MAG: UDP-N-acetylmuramoyl-L-alanine--D-glutamate ligase [Planctomycetota bacterium]